MDKSVKRGAIMLDRREPSLQAADLVALADLWLADCADRLDELRPAGYVGTTAGYAYKLAWFTRWWTATGPGCGWMLTQARLREFERWLRGQDSRHGEPLSYHSRQDVLRRLRQMLKWAEGQGYISYVTPSAWVPAAVGDPPVRQMRSDEDLLALLRAAAGSSSALRDLAILAVLIGTGVRRAECARIWIEDVTIYAGGSGVLLVRHPKRTRRGAKPRPVAFDAQTGAYLLRYLAVLPERGPLFPSRVTGQSLTPQSIYRSVRRCWLAAGLKADQPCHDLRRQFVTNWRRVHRGRELDDLLQRQVGHAGAAMTDHYTLTDVGDLVSVATSPMERIGDRL